MPVHERNYIAGDVFDLSGESRKMGLEGAMTNLLAAAGDTPDVERAVGEATGIARPAAPSLTPGDGTISVAWSMPAGADAVSIIVTRAVSEDAPPDDTGRTVVHVVAKAEDDSTPLSVTSLENGVEYEVYLRGVKDDGRVGPYSEPDSATPAL